MLPGISRLPSRLQPCGVVSNGFLDPQTRAVTCSLHTQRRHAIARGWLVGPTYCLLRQPQLSRSFSTSRDRVSVSNLSHRISKQLPYQPPLNGLTCMVTGGSSGIGFAIAERFLREGAEKVILVGRSKKRLRDAVRELEGDFPLASNDNLPQNDSWDIHDTAERATQPVQSIEYDNVIHDQPREVGIAAAKDCEISHVGQHFTLAVGDVGNPAFWGDEIKKLMDTVDILINAAGISYTSLLPLAKDEDITAMIHTNLQGTIFACRTMARRAMRSHSRQKFTNANGDNTSFTKCIINISSLHATKGGVGAATYASTKAGVVALTRAIVAESAGARQWARLRANVIVPGYIETKMVDDLKATVSEQALQAIPLQRFGRVEEVADAAVFLVTNQYANNCVLNLDGGLSAV
ncbi:3-oxoacyl-acyl carrier protein reductase [Histoplasma capsulatum G186AR]|uniref:3-oxoacyl-acyl carrier protein reductase n=1 Tax=Ajellomyces capsulatus TaxID=5037 RepID=A0A8H7YVN2_AJECA|nr:3-oxoacyl-acyl carrier protein reductase [Histoplasma capsulatum]QSS67075.1 3-oxoacyl-acyl carrier protein reductase [Histoplasma capsulatum G186AR]